MKEGRFRRTRRVEPGDVDGLGHVNNVAWLRFAVELAHAHARSNREAACIVREAQGVWLARRHELDYHRNLGVGEELCEETWVEAMRGARCLRGFRFTRQSDGALLVEGRSHWAFCDAGTLRARRIPAALAAAYLSP